MKEGRARHNKSGEMEGRKDPVFLGKFYDVKEIKSVDTEFTLPSATEPEPFVFDHPELVRPVEVPLIQVGVSYNINKAMLVAEKINFPNPTEEITFPSTYVDTVSFITPSAERGSFDRVKNAFVSTDHRDESSALSTTRDNVSILSRHAIEKGFRPLVYVATDVPNNDVIGKYDISEGLNWKSREVYELGEAKTFYDAENFEPMIHRLNKESGLEDSIQTVQETFATPLQKKVTPEVADLYTSFTMVTAPLETTVACADIVLKTPQEDQRLITEALRLNAELKKLIGGTITSVDPVWAERVRELETPREMMDVLPEYVKAELQEIQDDAAQLDVLKNAKKGLLEAAFLRPTNNMRAWEENIQRDVDAWYTENGGMPDFTDTEKVKEMLKIATAANAGGYPSIFVPRNLVDAYNAQIRAKVIEKLSEK